MACTRRWARELVVPGYEDADGIRASRFGAGCSEVVPALRMEKTFEFVCNDAESSRGMGKGRAVRLACFLRILRAASALAN